MIGKEKATNKCNMIYKNAPEVTLCQRIAMAGKSVALLLAECRYCVEANDLLVFCSTWHLLHRLTQDLFYPEGNSDSYWD